MQCFYICVPAFNSATQIHSTQRYKFIFCFHCIYISSHNSLFIWLKRRRTRRKNRLSMSPSWPPYPFDSVFQYSAFCFVVVDDWKYCGNCRLSVFYIEAWKVDKTLSNMNQWAQQVSACKSNLLTLYFPYLTHSLSQNDVNEFSILVFCVLCSVVVVVAFFTRI